MAFEPNYELATMPAGTKIAFDPKATRVWRICPQCDQWNLVGAEDTTTALPELQLRFLAGAIQHYETMSLSRIGRALELMEVKGPPNEVALYSDPHGALRRDDTAAALRRKELNRATLKQNLIQVGVLTSMLWIWVNDLRDLWVAGRFTPLVLVISAVLSATLLNSMRKSAGMAKGTRTPATMALSLLNSAYLCVAITAIVSHFMTSGKSAENFGPVILIMCWVVTLSLALLMALPSWRKRAAFRTKIAVYSIFTVASLGMVLLNIASIAVLGAVAVIGAFVVGSLKLVERYAKRREQVLRYPGDDGVERTLALELTTPISIAWDSGGSELAVFNLPGAASVDGRAAKRVIRDTLRYIHEKLPPTSLETLAASELLRSLGGAHGVLQALTGFAASQDHRVHLLSLPVSYRLALDLALAAEDATPNAIYLHEVHADDAVSVAEEAERLDVMQRECE